MGKIKKHLPVKLITGFIFRDGEHLNKAKVLLEREFGEIDFTSPIIPFNHTAYYEKEFGKDLKRCFVSFRKLIPAQGLPKIKTITNKIEKKLTLGTSASLSTKGKQSRTIGASRNINIDPGYLDLARLILASTKDYKHRIYLNHGIYAEVTLFYQRDTFRSWEWTYPDYRTPEYICIFNRIREIYAQQIKDK